MADNQSQKRCTMDSLKEKDNPTPNPAKRPRIEVDEELMRQMIAGQDVYKRQLPYRRRPLRLPCV